MIYSASKCPCGHRACKDWHVVPVAAIQGVNFTEQQAIAVAELLTKMSQAPWHVTSVVVSFPPRSL